ncbi:Glutathione-specific gamma-glutamylcyclotransferase 1 [Frankliniella fusca]|uniref:glutathione-specific gamma-glutamylcyclotransferase n=1 Tax=Frankliniella fusca TaxID=407009 RepID=A0AAE1L5Z3_9NEOP|nr:Glutathione-specific gamma-glutamylcyclotransferase 1 [Frankliniella fusca]
MYKIISSHLDMEQAPVPLAAAAAAPAVADPSDAEASGLWVFGYGSLCWHPGFDFRRSVTGFVRGYSRKFWQGNTTHRGTESQGIVWGRAFEVSGEAALPYLANRECKLGGYVTKFATFFPKRPCQDDDASSGPVLCPGQPFPALLYVATPSNRLWLGEAPLCQIARQIVECRGATGHNVEYLLRLAEYMRAAAPEADDDHLFSLEELVRHEIRQRRLCLDTLMGVKAASRADALAAAPSSSPVATVIEDSDDDDDEADDRDVVIGNHSDRKGDAAAEAALHHLLHHHHQHQPEQAALQQAQQAQQQEAFAFSSRVQTKKLRCLNI